MRTVTFNVYHFNELPKNIQEVVIKNLRQEIDDCWYAFFHQWEKQMQHNYEDETIIEYLKSCDWEFQNNGTLYSGD